MAGTTHLVHLNLGVLLQTPDVQFVQCVYALSWFAGLEERLPEVHAAGNVIRLHLERLLERRHRVARAPAVDEGAAQHYVAGLLVGPFLDELLELGNRLGVVPGLESRYPLVPAGGRGGRGEQCKGRYEGASGQAIGRSAVGHLSVSVVWQPETPDCSMRNVWFDVANGRSQPY